MTREVQKEIFVSCAGQDRDQARELVEHLEKLGCTAFIFTRDIPAAAEWEEVLVEELESARLFAVLLSANTKKARYQRAEIRKAIQLADTSDLKIAPILLEENFDSVTDFVLDGFQFTSLHKIGVEATARKLAKVLGKGDGVAAPEPDREELHTFGAFFHRASLKIDRTKQWLPIREICAGKENAFFLLHGPRQQNLDLFVGRLWCFLAQECERPHRCYIVRMKEHFSTPQSAAGWETHLAAGLSKGSRRAGKAVDLLREAARKQSVFLLLNRLPIGARDLEDRELEALEEFLSQVLPRLIAEASKGGQPIRALLTTHYDTEQESLVDRLDAKALHGCEAHGVRYRKLSPVRRVTWEDIQDFLDGLPRRPPASLIRKLREGFEALDGDGLEFRDIVELLERELGE